MKAILSFTFSLLFTTVFGQEILDFKTREVNLKLYLKTFLNTDKSGNFINFKVNITDNYVPSSFIFHFENNDTLLIELGNGSRFSTTSIGQEIRMFSPEVNKFKVNKLSSSNVKEITFKYTGSSFKKKVSKKNAVEFNRLCKVFNGIAVFDRKNLSASVKTTSPKTNQTSPIPTYTQPVVKETFLYDSLKNFHDKGPRAMIGQELLIKPKSESLKKYGYDDFFKKPSDLLTSKENQYNAFAKTQYENYDQFANRLIKITGHSEGKYTYDFFKAEFSDGLGEPFYVKYSKYNVSFLDHDFICMGFFKKMQEIYVGDSLILSGQERKVIDIQTGDSVDIKTGQIWNVNSIVMDPEYSILQLVLTRDGKTIVRSLNDIIERFTAYIYRDFEGLKGLYGADIAYTILAKKIRIGMTKDQVVLSWGKPEKKNISSYQEQWVYHGQYVYFKDGKVKSWN